MIRTVVTMMMMERYSNECVAYYETSMMIQHSNLESKIDQNTKVLISPLY